MDISIYEVRDCMENLKKYFSSESFFWATFFILMIIKYGYYGFSYYPILDDWIQYGGFSLYPNIFNDVLINIGTYMTRPLAALSDPYIWAQLWGRMGIAFFIITMMHGASAYFLYKVLEYQGLKVGMMFLVVYGLLPLGTESTYWISASSRLVVSVFWMALALYMLALYVKTFKRRYIFIYTITHLLSLGYYEQVVALSCFSAVVLSVINWRRIVHKWIVIVPFVNFGIIAWYYNSFGNSGNVAARGEMVQQDYLAHFGKVLENIAEIWGPVQRALMANGFVRGWEILIEDSSYLYLLCMVLASVTAGYFAYRKKQQEERDVSRLIIMFVIGFLLFWVPFAINFALETVWICLRNVFTSFIGLALMVTALVNLMLRGRIGSIARSVLIGCVAFIFLVVNISEITDYKNAGEIDAQIADNIISAVNDPAFFSGDKSAVVFNTESTYIEQNIYYKDHIHNVTSSDWALTGAVRARARNLNIRGFIMNMWPGSGIPIRDQHWEEAIILGIQDDLSVVHLRVEQKMEDEMYLYTVENVLFGIARKDEARGRYFYESNQ